MDDFKEWQDIVKILAEDIREIKALTKETRELVTEVRRSADAAERKADAAWELVVITRNEIKERAERHWYKKLLTYYRVETLADSCPTHEGTPPR